HRGRRLASEVGRRNRGQVLAAEQGTSAPASADCRRENCGAALPSIVGPTWCPPTIPPSPAPSPFPPAPQPCQPTPSRPPLVAQPEHEAASGPGKCSPGCRTSGSSGPG